jgi:hypothetical protein
MNDLSDLSSPHTVQPKLATPAAVASAECAPHAHNVCAGVPPIAIVTLDDDGDDYLFPSVSTSSHAQPSQRRFMTSGFSEVRVRRSNAGAVMVCKFSLLVFISSRHCAVWARRC